MRRLLFVSISALALAAAGPRHRTPPGTAQSQGQPPHAWLFGAWTGGIFPVLPGMLQQDCQTQPTVAFGRDVVRHASLTGASLSERVIETVRASPTGTDFRFTPLATDKTGFGCSSPDELTVTREPDGKISFPHCSAFPYELERCPPR